MAEKMYTTDDIIRKFDKLSNPKKVIVLRSALSHMETYNGRSQSYTIALGMGYEDNNDWPTMWKKQK